MNLNDLKNFFGLHEKSFVPIVGIGTTNPEEKLEISSDAWSSVASNVANTSQYPAFVGLRARGSQASKSIIANGDRLLGIFGRGWDGAANVNAGAIAVEVDGAPGTNDMPGRLLFYTTADGASSSSERMRITSTGYVGIGTNAPSTKLEVAGTIKATAFEGPLTSTTVSTGAGAVGTPSLSFSGDPNTGFYSNGADVIGVAANGANIFNFSSAGLVSPTTGGGLVTTANGTAGAPTFSFSGDPDTGWFRPGADTLAASTGGAERVRITSTGNVGVGMTPVTLVDATSASANNTMRLSSTGINYLVLRGDSANALADAGEIANVITFSADGGTATTTPSNGMTIEHENWASQHALTFNTYNGGVVTENMRIHRNGNVGIGTNAPVASLNVYNPLTSTTAKAFMSTGIWNNTSDNIAIYGQSFPNTSTTGAYASYGLSTFTAPIINSGTSNTSTIFGAYTNVRRNNTGVATDNDSGTLANLRGLSTLYGHSNDNTSATPITTNVYGLYLEPTNNYGTIGTHYGIYMKAIDRAPATANYGMYAPDATATHYFGGDIGVGTTTPGYKMDIYDTTPTLRLRSASNNAVGATLKLTEDVTENGGFLRYQATANTLDLGVIDNATERIGLSIARSSGFVGIGTSTPGQLLHVYKAGASAQLLLETDGGGSAPAAYLVLKNGASTAGTQTFGWKSQTDSMSLNLLNDAGTSSVTRIMTALASGNVGIGATLPTVKLQVNGGTDTSLADGSGFVVIGSETSANLSIDNNELQARSAGAAASMALQGSGGNLTVNGGGGNFAIGSSSVFYLNAATGYVSIGAGASPSHILHINGQGRATNAAWATTSDIRLKDIQGDYQYGLDEILQLHTVWFNYKKDNPFKLDSRKTHAGIIAQELKKVIPEAVEQTEDGYYTVNSDPVHWAVINAIKQLYHKLMGNEESIKALRTQDAVASRDIASLQSKDTAKDKEIVRLKEENARKSKELAELKARMDRLEKMIQSK